MKLSRRALLAGGGLALAGCSAPAREPQGGWIGASAARGHRLRETRHHIASSDGPLRRCRVLIAGGGVAGLACARALMGAGLDDIALLELEDEAGGNSRGHRMAGLPCPQGAHYLPLPGPAAPEISELLEALGLARQQLGRTVYDERHLCHSPQERLFYEGRWIEGLLPPASPGSPREAQYRQFADRVREAQRDLGFAMPSRRAPWTAGHRALDAQHFDSWLDAQGLNEPGLRWYLDYCCRDDYGAGSASVSAWAGLHYFASRHGFMAGADEGEREAVLTWPEGNAWLSQRLAEGLGPRLRSGQTLLRISPGRHQVQAWAWNEAAGRVERWTADQLVLALPLMVAVRLVDAPPPALQQAAPQLSYAPWLVSNLLLEAAPLDRLGVGPAWDSVVYGSPALGYVDARHQELRPAHSGPALISHYWALPLARRGELLSQDWGFWARQVLAELASTHPDLPQRLLRLDMARYGHAMSVPLPGVRSSPALQALATQAQGRLHFAHSDLAGYSVFEEAYTQGLLVAQRLSTR